MTFLSVSGWLYIPDTGVPFVFSAPTQNLPGKSISRSSSLEGGRGNLPEFDELKRKLQEQMFRRTPGITNYLNIICKTTYGVDCTSLLFASPTRLFHVILNYYGGDFYTVCYLFKIVFLNPLAEILSKPELSDQLLELAKLGKDEEFIKLILSTKTKS